MKSDPHSSARLEPAPAVRATTRFTSQELYALVFGLFLGLALLKFGNPIILDDKISAPTSGWEARNDPWPPHWATVLLVPLALVGAGLAVAQKSWTPMRRSLWVLPAVWLGWQFLSASATVDRRLTGLTLWQFTGCVACYFLGVHVLGRKRGLHLLLAGLLAAFVICLLLAYQQWIEIPQTRQALVQGEQMGWTNLTADVISRLKRDQFIISTNGVDIANPIILEKLAKRRVYGTLVYPNALAGAILLLFPAAIVIGLNGTRSFRTATRATVLALISFLGLSGLFWSGSKSGWLLAIGMGTAWLWRTRWSTRLKWGVLIGMVVVGMALFGLRFHNYFAAGATSVGARFDYWRIAARVALEHPLFGSGPGTFQRPYALLKAPEAEMARLTHNDYLEQFSDSGLMGGISYALWIGLLAWIVGHRVWQRGDLLEFAIFVGVSGWFAQGFIEFSLYVPALAWTAFALTGCLLARNPFDKSPPAR